MKKHPFPIGGKMYHADQSKNDMTMWRLVVLEEGDVSGVMAARERERKKDRGKKRERVMRCERFVTLSMFGVCSYCVYLCS